MAKFLWCVAGLAALTLLHVTLMTTAVLHLGSTMCTSFLGRPVSSMAFNEAALGKDPPERMVLQTLKQLRKLDTSVLLFSTAAGFTIGLLATLLCAHGCSSCLVAIHRRCSRLRCTILGVVAVALCLAAALGLAVPCTPSAGGVLAFRCQLSSMLQKLWKLGHRTLILLIISYGLGALIATACSCSREPKAPYLPVTDVKAEAGNGEAKMSHAEECCRACLCQTKLCKVRMGVLTCLVFTTIGTLAFALFRAYKGTCQLAADMQDLRIIFITRAQPRNYGKRLQGQLDTWMNDLPREDLFITSFTLPADKPLSEKDRQSVMEFNCPDNHALGVCCVEANALIQMQNRTFDWVFIVDDDVYVVVENLRRVLARAHPRSQLQTDALGYGITGCVTKGRPCGFCGGGGYALSAKAVKVLLGSDTQKFMRRYMEDCSNTKYCDVTTECLAEQNGTKVFKMHGLHPWRVGNPTWNMTAMEGFFHAQQLQECPISFHYVQEALTMKRTHELAKRYVPEFGHASTQAADGQWC